MLTTMIILFTILATTVAAAPPYNLTFHYLINCGTDSTTTSDGGERKWDTDTKFSPLNYQSISNTSTPSIQSSSTTQVPYTTARIFRQSPFTYTFPVSAGPIFLRLYFYPATYSALNISDSFFSVTAGDYTLLKNFSALFTTASLVPKQAYCVKEFYMEVGNKPSLEVTFSPSPNSYAFINGIEIISVPVNYYVKGTNKQPANVGQRNPFFLDNSTAMETLYRLNVGGNDVNRANDSGMFRLWVQDDDYILSNTLGKTPDGKDIPIKYTAETPKYSAPEMVYRTARIMNNNSQRYNMSWSFPVDSGFHYLLRLYFCEIQQGVVTRVNERAFTIDICNTTAQERFDVIEESGGERVPIYKDYVVFVSNEQNNVQNTRDLWLTMYPTDETKPVYLNAILNGLEIFRINGSEGSLAAPNPDPPIAVPTSPPSSGSLRNRNNHKNPRLMTFAVIGSIIAGVSIVLIMLLLVFRRREKRKRDGTSVGKSSYGPISNASKSTNTNASSLPSGLCHRFSLAEINSATRNFDDNFIIGVGGFGNVYRGYIKTDSGETAVAIKRLNVTSTQGIREFETEIELLSKLRHRHLVSLIGYCDENGEMVLVYDYMSNGTLRDHLYNTNKSPLSWNQRLQICIGSAKGLLHLHTGTKHKIIHRDVKSTNILLDEKFVAKVSDFGLSKEGSAAQTHVSTVVKGSFGYLDPEYCKRQQLTEKSDVYSFGVVLFEVLCSRPVIDPALPKERVSLVAWAKQSFQKQILDDIVDPKLKDEIAPECLIKFSELAYSCVRSRGADRPSMNDIVWSLEFALQLQQSADKMKPFEDNNEDIATIYSPMNFTTDKNTTNNDNDTMFSDTIEEVSMLGTSSSSNTQSSYSDKMNSGSVFSEKMNTQGR
jgi:serine/threonine protein kinase